jgi:molybdate/tungstate transport system ATP-binding protein
LLLDEPLAALDPCFREEIRDLFKRLHSDTGLTVLMVTHDFTDAHSLAHRIAILHDGCIEQEGKVHTVFTKPASKMVADFVGMKNVLPVRLSAVK